jgi:surface antigen
MAGPFLRLALAAALGFALSGCASEPDNYAAPSDSFSPADSGAGARVGAIRKPDTPLQCVPFARQASGISIFGDANTWWNKAAGRFERGNAPKQGAVMVLAGYAGPNHAHLAVVRELVSTREIKVDHANWFNDGQVYVGDPVLDVSNDNDWTMVRIWNIRTSAWGTRDYPVQGFIGPGPDNGNAAVASAGPSSPSDERQALNRLVISSR